MTEQTSDEPTLDDYAFSLEQPLVRRRTASIVVDTEGNIISANKSALDHAGGISPEDVKDHNIMEFVQNKKPGEIFDDIIRYAMKARREDANLDTLPMPTFTVTLPGGIKRTFAAAAQRAESKSADGVIKHKGFFVELYDITDELKLQIREDLLKKILGPKPVKEVVDILAKHLDKAIPYGSAGIMLLDHKTGHLTSKYAWENGGEVKNTKIPSEAQSVSDWATLQMMSNTRKPLLINDTGEATDLWTPSTTGAITKSYLGAPLTGLVDGREEVIGFLHINSANVRNFTADDIDDIREIAAAISTALENAKLQELLKEDSLHDPLTHALNRRAYNELIEPTMTDTRTGFSIIEFDADHFKAVNDTYGHKVGDEVLKTIINIMKKQARKTDHVIRHGGEEFIIHADDTNISGIMRLGQRVMREMEHTKIASGIESLDDFTVTLSMGIVHVDSGHGYTPDDIYRAYDRALYAAKDLGGRNCTAVYFLPPKESSGKHFIGTYKSASGSDGKITDFHLYDIEKEWEPAPTPSFSLHAELKFADGITPPYSRGDTYADVTDDSGATIATIRISRDGTIREVDWNEQSKTATDIKNVYGDDCIIAATASLNYISENTSATD